MSDMLRRATTVAAVLAVTVILGAWGAVGCPDHRTNPAPINEACSPNPDDLCTAGQGNAGQIKKKLGLTNRFVWVWANGTIAEFDISDQRAFFDWGYNLATRNIRWINKSGVGRCLTPIGSCTNDYGVWRTEVCDRSGPDTCLFRREAMQTVSFTYGVAFNSRLISCVGTRIDWDGGTTGTRAGDCGGGGGGAAAAAMSARFGAAGLTRLTVGTGKNAVVANRHLSRAQLAPFGRACLSRRATNATCRPVALRLFHSLPDRVQRKVRGQVQR